MTDTAAPALPAGLTARDYLAGCALTVLLPHAVGITEGGLVTREGAAGATINLSPPGVRWACTHAYQIADVMLRAAAAARTTAAELPPPSDGDVLAGPGSNGHVSDPAS